MPPLDQPDSKVRIRIDGIVSVPGFAEATVTRELEVEITNLFEEPNGLGVEPLNANEGILDIGFSMQLMTMLGWDLQTPCESLDILNASAIVSGNGLGSGTSDVIGPSAFGPYTSRVGPLTWSIPLGPGESYSLEMMVEVEGGVSAVAAIPAPSSLLLGTGLLGLTGTARRRKI